MCYFNITFQGLTIRKLKQEKRLFYNKPDDKYSPPDKDFDKDLIY